MCNTKSYIPDDDLPFIWFQVGGHAFKLRPSQYMLTGTDSCAIGYDCMGISFLDSMGQHTYIMGDTFLREYYLVFDETHYKVGIGSLDDQLTLAIPRPPVVKYTHYISLLIHLLFILFFKNRTIFGAILRWHRILLVQLESLYVLLLLYGN